MKLLLLLLVNFEIPASYIIKWCWSIQNWMVWWRKTAIFPNCLLLSFRSFRKNCEIFDDVDVRQRLDTWTCVWKLTRLTPSLVQTRKTGQTGQTWGFRGCGVVNTYVGTHCKYFKMIASRSAATAASLNSPKRSKKGRVHFFPIPRIPPSPYKIQGSLNSSKFHS